MKYMMLLALLAMSACASGPKLQVNCDTVQNRDHIYVCGTSDVVKNCNPVVSRDQSFVCDPL